MNLASKKKDGAVTTISPSTNDNSCGRLALLVPPMSTDPQLASLVDRSGDKVQPSRPSILGDSLLGQNSVFLNELQLSFLVR